jgi:hypothetical protein
MLILFSATKNMFMLKIGRGEKKKINHKLKIEELDVA